MSHLLPLFYEDYFVYWGKLETADGSEYKIKWLVPRAVLSASYEQVIELKYSN